MNYALFSDIHADEASFAKLQQCSEFQAAGKRVCLGDVINAHDAAGAPEFFQKVQQACDVVVMGNHEAVLIGQCDVQAFSPKIQTMITATQSQIQASAASFLTILAELPLTVAIGSAQATHASFNSAHPWRHIRYTEDVQTEAAYLPAKVNFTAHGHIPFIAWLSDGLWYYDRQIYNRTFKLLPATTYVINTGSVLGSREMRQYERTFLTYDDGAAEVVFYNMETI